MRPKSQAGGLLVALLTAAIAAVVNGLLWPEFGRRYPLIGFYPAIVVTAYIGGAGAAVVCTMASAVIAAVVWLDPQSSMTTSRATDAIALTVFASIGAVISLLTDISAKRIVRERAARERAERAERNVADELGDVQRLQRFMITVFRRDDPAVIVRDLLHVSIKLVSAAAGHVHMLDSDEGTLNLLVQVGLAPNHVGGRKDVDDAADPIATAFRHKEEVVVAGADDAVSTLRLHAVPIITAEGMALGVLTTYRDGRPLAERRTRFLATSVQQAAQAIERCRLLDAERTTRRAAEHANRLKDAFLSTVSHELRTPLNAVLGWADMLRSGRLSEAAAKRALSAIADNARRQMELIAELLDVSRITAGTLRIAPMDVRVMEVVQRAVEVVEPAARAKHVQLSVEGAEMLCHADPGRLQQIVWNLLANAVKFTPAGGAITVAVHRRGEHVDIEVRDTGQGIRTDFLPHVFEPFRQGDATTTRTEGGLGLGLSIVRHLVEAHGGVVSAESAGEGQGARFTVRLPVGVVGTPSTRAEPGDARTSNLLAGISILVVDDDPDSREVLVASLEQAGAHVHVRASARDALTALADMQTDVILADVAMPEQDGYAFIRRVRASSATDLAVIPAIALTSLARETDRKDALTAGFQLHLTKPIAPRALVEAIAHVVHDLATPVNK
jgi:K+-sensing histidine kinase KdpD/ActR/RegA family two-component response regulator